MIKFLSQCVLPLVLLAASAGALAGERPLPVYNQGALARAFELPVLGETRVLAPGEAETALRFDLTSEYSASANDDEAATLDGEADLLTFAFRRSLVEGLEWTAELPVLYQGGGFMDQSIENWHDFFGLPNGGREDAPRNRYLYQYEHDGQILLDQTRQGADLGDLRIGLGWQALPGLALRTEIKTPTGSAKHLSGGNVGGALWADWALPFAADSILSGFLSAGGSLNDKADAIRSQQNNFVPFASAGLAVRLFERFAVLAQFYGHGKLYDDSQLDPFREALQFSMGLRYHVSRDFAFDIGFQEDPITSSSPDFSLHFGFSMTGL